MTKENKTQAIINKIKKEKIKPDPKWQYQLLNGFFWLSLVVAVVLSSMFFSFILMNLFELPVEIFWKLKVGSYFRVIFSVLPYLWILLVLASLSLGLVAFQKTRYGYRYRFIVIVSMLMTAVFFLGLILRSNSVGHPLRNIAEKRIPAPLAGGPLNKAQKSRLIEEGLLGGEIIEKSPNRIFISNLSNEKWEVVLDEKTRVQKEEPLIIGDKIIIIGEDQGDFFFKAFVIKKIEDCHHCRGLEQPHRYESEDEED